MVFSIGIAIALTLTTCNQSAPKYTEELKRALLIEYKAHIEKNAPLLVATFSDSFVSVDRQNQFSQAGRVIETI